MTACAIPSSSVTCAWLAPAHDVACSGIDFHPCKQQVITLMVWLLPSCCVAPQDWFYRRRSKDCASATKQECPEQLMLEAEQVQGELGQSCSRQRAELQCSRLGQGQRYGQDGKQPPAWEQITAGCRI